MVVTVFVFSIKTEIPTHDVDKQFEQNETAGKFGGMSCT